MSAKSALTKLLKCPRKLHFSRHFSSTTEKASQEPEKWNRLVHEAENLVNFPTHLVGLRTLLNDDVSGITEQMNRLMGSGHPVLNTLQKLTNQEQLQVRGLLILLMARTCRSKFENESDFEPEFGVLTRQRKLAEYVEMIYAAQSIHKSVLNISQDFHQNPESDLKEKLSRLEYGNKMAILGGDFLLVNACTGLADLRNTFCVEMISIAIANFTQSEFLGHRDIQGRFVPNEQHITLDSWIHRNMLAYGDLMSSGCKSVLKLGNIEGDFMDKFSKTGSNLSLALQAFHELQLFNQSAKPPVLDLSAAPVIFQLQNDSELLDYIQGYKDDITEIDSGQIFEKVKSGVGIEMAKALVESHLDSAIKNIDNFENEESRDMLLKIVNFLKG